MSDSSFGDLFGSFSLAELALIVLIVVITFAAFVGIPRILGGAFKLLRSSKNEQQDK